MWTLQIAFLSSQIQIGCDGRVIGRSHFSILTTRAGWLRQYGPSTIHLASNIAKETYRVRRHCSTDYPMCDIITQWKWQPIIIHHALISGRRSCIIINNYQWRIACACLSDYRGLIQTSSTTRKLNQCKSTYDVLWISPIQRTVLSDLRNANQKWPLRKQNRQIEGYRSLGIPCEVGWKFRENSPFRCSWRKNVDLSSRHCKFRKLKPGVFVELKITQAFEPEEPKCTKGGNSSCFQPAFSQSAFANKGSLGLMSVQWRN